MQEGVVHLMVHSPVQSCNHVKKRADTWLCVPSWNATRTCRGCFHAANPECFSCGRFIVDTPKYFGMSVTRMGGSKVSDHFIAPACSVCAHGVPLGEWGVDWLETVDQSDGRRIFIMYEKWTRDVLPDV